MSEPLSRVAVYTGSFDPITLGHLNIIERASRIFDRLIVGIGHNIDKSPLFSTEERKEFARRVTGHLDNVEIQQFSGLAVKFVRQAGAKVLVRGVRPLTDIAAEITMMLANRELDPEVETVFLMADQGFVHVSSSLFKQIASVADDAMLARFVPSEIIPRLREKIPYPLREFSPLGEFEDHRNPDQDA